MYLDYNSNHPILEKVSVIHTLLHRNKQVCCTPEFLQKKWIIFTKSYKRIPTQHSLSIRQAPTETNRKPKPSTRKIIVGVRDVIPYIKDLIEKHRHTLAKYKVRVSFKGTSTIKSLLMHPKNPHPDAQRPDIIYNWKCQSHNCTAECIVKTNISLKERVSDHRNQTTGAIRNHHLSAKHPKALSPNPRGGTFFTWSFNTKDN